MSEKLSNLSKVSPLVSSGEGFEPGRPAPAVPRKSPERALSPNSQLESGLLDFPDEFRQFYDLSSSPWYLFCKGCQISCPLASSAFVLRRCLLAFNPRRSSLSFVTTNPQRPRCWPSSLPSSSNPEATIAPPSGFFPLKLIIMEIRYRRPERVFQCTRASPPPNSTTVHMLPSLIH